MRIRVLLAAAAVALTAVATAWSAGAGAAFSTCGTVSGGGAKWSVVASHVACSAAKPLVKKLAAKPRTGLATRLGTHLGLKCIEYSKKRKREIACVSKDGLKSVYGVTPPRR
jgi:hypothetical protein